MAEGCLIPNAYAGICFLTEVWAVHMLSDMDVRTEIKGIEEQMAEAGVSIASLCRLAGLNQTSWVRWKNGMPARRSSWDRVRNAVNDVVRDSKLSRSA
jgi:hypothetical protein